ncbi:hypothetical protein ACP70R_042290 [Stipagrostis hirtigluma subsp. patula]
MMLSAAQGNFFTGRMEEQSWSDDVLLQLGRSLLLVVVKLKKIGGKSGRGHRRGEATAKEFVRTAPRSSSPTSRTTSAAPSPASSVRRHVHALRRSGGPRKSTN